MILILLIKIDAYINFINLYIDFSEIAYYICFACLSTTGRPAAGRKGKIMSYKLISECPVCSSTLKATRLSCLTCGTVIESDFELSKFELLNKEQLKFAEVFIKNRGSIKDVEREMGISYPTVKGKLNDVIKALGYKVEEEPSANINEVITELEKGSINIDEAIKKIKK